tara:strand:- start:305 stop:505 length:201 start_codon:yes stop_codon:yes gene_type:complete
MMPLFTQQCPDCGHQFEVLVSVKDIQKDQACSACGSPRTVRQVSKTNFSLQGGGWASEGYAKGGDE